MFPGKLGKSLGKRVLIREPGQSEPFGNRNRLESADGNAGFGLLIADLWGARVAAGGSWETASRKAMPCTCPCSQPLRPGGVF